MTQPWRHFWGQWPSAPGGPRRSGWLGLLAVALLVALPTLAATEPKTLRGVALVIGNADYENLPALANPANDADAVEALLADLGFDSVRRTDRDARSMRRDLERFAEDADGADVAVLYYAGHGIEAGGENFLVPVDADLAALDDADERLVPVSEILAELRRTVAVTIVLLDACRDNPFPPGATLRESPGAEPVAVSAGGLGETRGARAVGASTRSDADNLGMVIGFAAEPGRPALDGPAGEHSPYAAALIRHIDAMAGAEFGTVMRMVAEEVYLKTGGRQRPWVNESLRRLLYLGEEPPERDGPEAAVLGERRQLLVHIAALPDPQRSRAETLARSGRVPMSVVFAMMQAAGVDPDEDPEKVEARLKAEIERFAALKAERRSLSNPDPEIRRLTDLADAAELEGALNAANGFRDEAKARVAALRETRQDQLRDIRARILEDADVYVRSAETKKLLFRFDEAARDYGAARLIAADVDPLRAEALLDTEIETWLTHTEITGAADALDRAETLARTALAGTAPRSPAGEAALKHRLAAALMVRAARSGDIAPLNEALGLLEAAQAAGSATTSLRSARIALDLGRVRGELVLRENRTADLRLAIGDFERAAERAREAGDAALEAEARFRTVQALFYLWSASPSADLMAELTTRLAGTIELINEDMNDVVAVRYFSRAAGIAYEMALRQNTTEALASAGEIAALTGDIFDAERFPLIGADVASLAGRIQLEWAERFGDASGLGDAIELQRRALDTYRSVGAAAAAREARYVLASILIAAGRREMANEKLVEAAALLDALGGEAAIRADPALSRVVAFDRARATAIMARKHQDAEQLRQAVADYRTIEAGLPGDATELAARLRLEIGRSLAVLGQLDQDPQALRTGTDILSDVVASWEGWGARTHNLGPYLELYGDYANARSLLAIETRESEAIETAIDVQSQLLALYDEVGHADGAAVASNGLAYLLVTALRQTFDAERLARAEALAERAGAGVAAWPDFAGYVENTRCEIATERARHEADSARAENALAQCRHALALLTDARQEAVIATAEASVERALRLVETLDK